MREYSAKRAFASIGMALLAAAIFFLTIQVTGIVFELMTTTLLYSFLASTFGPEGFMKIIQPENTGIVIEALTKIFLSLQNQISAFYGVITVLIFIGIICIRKKSVKRELDLYRVNVGAPLAIPLLSISLYCIATLTISAVPYPDSWRQAYDSMMSSVTDSGSPAALYIAAVIVAPIAEEVTFRGIAYKSMAKNMPKPIAMVLSSAIFAVLHIGWGSREAIMAGTIQAIYAMLVALFMCYIYERYKSLIASITLHMCFNFLGLCAGFIATLQPWIQLLIIIVFSVLTIPEIIYIHRATRQNHMNTDTLNDML